MHEREIAGSCSHIWSSNHVQHLDWSPLEYIRWRYEIGEDREGLDKVDRAVRRLPDASLTLSLTLARANAGFL